jgi:hypothetical protein
MTVEASGNPIAGRLDQRLEDRRQGDKRACARVKLRGHR